ncbi:MAG: type II toxin-antitoxin system RelE/ParE family toxin, partial [Methylococcales bacterium]
MSAPKFRLELTEPAKLDFRDILSFTLRNWGEGQLAEYKRKINDALTAISENPHIGCKKHGMM